MHSLSQVIQLHNQDIRTIKKIMISAKDVAQLRKQTGAGIMDAKKALTEANGDFEKAVVIVQEKYASKALKKSDRETSEGQVFSYIHGGKIGVMVAIACETDFVARNEEFQELGKNIALHVASLLATGDPTIEEILSSPYIKDPSMTIEQLITSKVATIGENIKLTDFVKLSL